MKGIMGGTVATPTDLNKVPCPATTRTYTPIQHGDFRRELLTALEAAGVDLNNVKEDWRLAEGRRHRGGNRDKELGIYTGPGCRLFGLIKIGDDVDGTELAIATRSSTDKTIPCGVAGGGETGICTNLLIWGDELTIQKHSGTLNIGEFFRSAVNKVLATFPAFKAFIANCKSTPVNDNAFHGFLCDSLDAGVLPGSAANNMVAAWRRGIAPAKFEGFQDRLETGVYDARNAWSVRGMWEELVGNGMNRTQSGNDVINHQRVVNTILADRYGVKLV